MRSTIGLKEERRKGKMRELIAKSFRKIREERGTEQTDNKEEKKCKNGWVDNT